MRCSARTGALAYGNFRPVRQIIGVRIGVINKVAVFDQQAPRLRTVASCVPTERGRPKSRAQDFDGLRHMRALGLRIDLLIADPAQPMTGDLMPEFLESRGGLGMAAHRRGYREDG